MKHLRPAPNTLSMSQRQKMEVVKDGIMKFKINPQNEREAFVYACQLVGNIRQEDLARSFGIEPLEIWYCAKRCWDKCNKSPDHKAKIDVLIDYSASRIKEYKRSNYKQLSKSLVVLSEDFFGFGLKR